MDGTQHHQMQMNFTADDLTGILIHNCNLLASHLSVNGWDRANWIQIDGHLCRMLELAQRARVLVEQQAHLAADTQPN